MSTVRNVSRIWLRLCVVTVTFGLVQAVVETLVVAALYRNLLFAPYRFFTIQIYDAFTKIYFFVAGHLKLPSWCLDDFLGVGAVAKLRLLPELAAVNTLVGLIVALALLPIAATVGLRAHTSPRVFTRRAALLTLSVVTLVHLASWAVNVKLPLDPTFRNVTANLMRDAVLDGVAVALVVGLVAAACSALVTPNGAVTAVVAMAMSLPMFLGRPSAAAVVSAAHAAEMAAPAAAYNVVLVSIDSLRADHLGAYGYPRLTSPAIDRLAAEGALFDHCQSTTSWTLPAHMSMLTGRSLLGHGVVGDDRRLDESVPTVAQAFHAAGYATGAIVSAPYLQSRYGFSSGFDQYDDKTVSFDTNEASYKSVTAPLVNDTADTWLGQRAGGPPFFLFLHYWDVHYDYAPGPPYDTMFDPDYHGSMTGNDFYFNRAVNKHMDRRDLEHVVALYDGEIRLVDDHIGKLRATLERLALWKNTILVVTADHGDEFFEHGNKGHHRTLYEEVLHVPWILHVPGGVVAPQRITEEASIVDIMPTVLGLTGVAQPAGLEGNDFTPMLRGVSGPGAGRAVFAELYRKGSLNVQVAELTDREKLIHHFNVRRTEFYDLVADPGEHQRRSLDSGDGGTFLANLRDWLDARWQGYRKREEAHGIHTVEMDAKTAETLRALGYIQ